MNIITIFSRKNCNHAIMILFLYAFEKYIYIIVLLFILVISLIVLYWLKVNHRSIFLVNRKIVVEAADIHAEAFTS